jgi:hypothetical protein
MNLERLAYIVAPIASILLYVVLLALLPPSWGEAFRSELGAR